MARILVVDDWTMPRLNGVEMLARIRADPVIAATRFILLTARAQKIDEPDVDGFVTTPFSLVELMRCVDAVLCAPRVTA